jgi:hypothetical protein
MMPPPNSMPGWLNTLKRAKVSCEVCRQAIPVRQNTTNVGIRVGDQWFCSPRCFRPGTEREITRLLKFRVEQPVHGERMPLGLSLLRQQLVTVEQLRKASEEHKETGDELGDVLIRQGAVSEKNVTVVRAALWGCPVFAIANPPVPVSVNIPVTLMRSYSMVPVHYVASTYSLLAGFLHSIEYGLLYAIEQITRCSTKPCFVAPSDFKLQMEQQQIREAAAPDITVETVQSAAEIAQAICDSALEIEADDAHLERCKDYLWVRLKNQTRSLDLVFRVE